MATFAAGATPEIAPKSMPSTVAGTPLLPAAVLAVCEPWPSPSRGDRKSYWKSKPDSLRAGREVLRADQLGRVVVEAPVLPGDASGAEGAAVGLGEDDVVADECTGSAPGVDAQLARPRTTGSRARCRCRSTPTTTSLARLADAADRVPRRRPCRRAAGRGSRSRERRRGAGSRRERRRRRPCSASSADLLRGQRRAEAVERDLVGRAGASRRRLPRHPSAAS